MGIGVVILFYGFAYAALAALLSLLAWPFRVWLRDRPRLIRALLLAPLVIPAILPIGFFGTLVWINFAPPQYVYRSVFDRSPDASIHSLHAESSGFNDYREVYLSFQDAGPALQDALATARFEPAVATASNNLVPMPGGSAPQWWTAGRCQDSSVYVAKNVRRWDEIVITQCRNDATIYVQARWID